MNPQVARSESGLFAPQFIVWSRLLSRFTSKEGVARNNFSSLRAARVLDACDLFVKISA